MENQIPEKAAESLSRDIVKSFFTEMRRERRSRYFRTIVFALIFAISTAFYITVYKSSPLFADNDEQNLRIYQTVRFAGRDPSVSLDRLETIGILPIMGLITGNPFTKELAEGSQFGKRTPNMVARVKYALAKFELDRNLSTVILYIDSPGGTVIASDEIYRLISAWKVKTRVKVVAYLHSVAASGGYYVAQAGDTIIGNPSGLTGSIGVILSMMNFSELTRQFGVKAEYIKTGKYKDMGSPFRPVTQEEREILQSIVDESFETFISVIAEGRKHRLTSWQIRELADGRIFTGVQAKFAGLVDKNADFEEMLAEEIDRRRENHDSPGVKVIIYEPKKVPFLAGLLSQLSGSPELSIFNQVKESLPRREPWYLWLGGM